MQSVDKWGKVKKLENLACCLLLTLSGYSEIIFIIDILVI